MTERAGEGHVLLTRLLGMSVLTAWFLRVEWQPPKRHAGVLTARALTCGLAGVVSEEAGVGWALRDDRCPWRRRDACAHRLKSAAAASHGVSGSHRRG